MEIVKIYPPYIYSAFYNSAIENEFDLLFGNWNDVKFVMDFLTENKEWLSTSFWKRFSEPEDAARQILDEAQGLEELFETLYENTVDGSKPDFDDHFKYLGGKYKYELEYQPMKSYGQGRPSLLRIYAIKLSNNLYVITGGGIKLADTIQNSPDLKEHVLRNINEVRSYLRENGIIDHEDMEV